MSEAITVRRSGLVRMLEWARALAIVSDPEEFRAGSDFGSDVAVQPSVAPMDEMSAYTLAWVYICVQTCAADLAGLPRYVERDGEPMWDHPALDLLNNPSTTADPVLWGRQRWADWYLSAASYDLMLRATRGGEPVSLRRLHPARVSPVTADDGSVRAWEYQTGGAPTYYDADDVLVCSDISYEWGPQGVRGVSRIRALMRDLNVDVKALELANQSVGRGAPAFIVRPASDDDRWDQEQTAKIAKSINSMLAKVAGGALVLGGRSEVTPLGFSPREVEYIQQREATRQTILSAFRVTPTIVGLPGANYATADKEAEGYWMARKSDAALRDSADSRLAVMLGQPGDRIVTDFSGVAALRADRGARLNRAQQLWIMGVPLRQALDAEGLTDIEVPEERPRPAPAPQPAPAEEPARGIDWLRAESEQGTGDVPTSAVEIPGWRTPREESARAAEWRGFEEQLRGPAEKRLAAIMTRFLRDQAERMAARAEWQLQGARGVRTLDAQVLAIIDANAELQALIEAAGPSIEEAIARAILVMSKRLGTQIDPEQVAQAARDAITDSTGRVGGTLANVNETTAQAIADIVREGIADGQSPTLIADRIRRAAAFSPSRSLTIARTEVTRAVNAGSVATIEQAQANGAGVAEIEWLTSRDGHVRDEHIALDTKRRTLDGYFESGGKTAKAPGGFGDPALDANCRCTILPVLED